MNDCIRTEGAANLVDDALACSIGRFIQESVVMLYSDGAGAWLDETSATDDFPMVKGNHAAEASALRFSETDGAGVILRFGLFCGP